MLKIHRHRVEGALTFFTGDRLLDQRVFVEDLLFVQRFDQRCQRIRRLARAKRRMCATQVGQIILHVVEFRVAQETIRVDRFRRLVGVLLMFVLQVQSETFFAETNPRTQRTLFSSRIVFVRKGNFQLKIDRRRFRCGQNWRMVIVVRMRSNVRLQMIRSGERTFAQRTFEFAFAGVKFRMAIETSSMFESFA